MSDIVRGLRSYACGSGYLLAGAIIVSLGAHSGSAHTSERLVLLLGGTGTIIAAACCLLEGVRQSRLSHVRLSAPSRSSSARRDLKGRSVASRDAGSPLFGASSIPHPVAVHLPAPLQVDSPVRRTIRPGQLASMGR